MKNITIMIFIFCNLACKKTGSSASSNNNHAPLVAIASNLTGVNPFVYEFNATASDVDGDKLTYAWDFGEGTKKQGNSEENFSYQPNKNYTVKVSVSDGKAPDVTASTIINTILNNVTIDASQKYQTMQGFGGFGAKDVYWNGGPFTSADFVNDLINDLGLTILLDNIPTDFEDVNDDNDPHNTNLGNFHYNSFNDHIQYLKDIKAAGLQKLIVSCWSAPAWMKTNNNVNGPKADAPAYNPNPTIADNQLRNDMYDEFAERCVAYIKIIKKETGIDVYAISLQNDTGVVAVHGYALDGVTANSPDAQTWQNMYGWAAQYGMPLWITETSGYSNDMKGAMNLSKAMYTAINFGNVSAWLYWELSQATVDPFSLMSSSGGKSKRYYASKNFYHYVRPGDYRVKASADDGTNIYPVAFKNDTQNTNTVVLINDNTTDKAIKLSGENLPAQFNKYVTSSSDDCKDAGIVKSSDVILLPANSVTTLYKKN